MQDTDNPTTDASPPPSVWPSLRAADAHGLIRFLVDAFGFEATVVYEDGGQVTHAELAWPPGGGVMVGSAKDGDELAHRPGTTACYVVTDDPDRLHDRAVAAGAQIVRPLHDTDYGSRDFTARDPDGNTWSFGTYRGRPRP
jgi:uncharacterized glyoxalase superfamily protein PhnB